MQAPASSRLNGNGPSVRARARRRRNFCARAARRGQDDIGKADAVLTVCEQPTLQTCNSLPERAMRNHEQAGDPCLENGRFGICSIGLGSGVLRCGACLLAHALRQMHVISKPQAGQQGMLEQRRKQEACTCLGRSQFTLSTFDLTVCSLLILHALCDVRNDALLTVAKTASSKLGPIGSQSPQSCKCMG